jgi:hypothetical protein
MDARWQLDRIFTPDGNQTYVILDTLETLLSPALLCLLGRQAVITPIQKNYATHLLGNCARFSKILLGIVTAAALVFALTPVLAGLFLPRFCAPSTALAN